MEEQFTNHSEEVVQNIQVETQQESIQDQTQLEITSQPEEDFIPVKYNKEERKISRDQAPDLIQKGLYYDEKIKSRFEQLESQSSYVERLAKMSGYQTTEELFNAIEEAERTEKIQQESSKLGIDPEAYKQHFEPVNEKVSTLEQKLQQYEEKERQTVVEQEVNTLRSKYQDFDKYEEQVFDFAIQNGYRLEDAYKLVTYEDHIKNLGQQKEQEAIEKLQSNSTSTPGSLGAGAEHKTGYSNLSASEKKALRERVLRGENIQL